MFNLDIHQIINYIISPELQHQLFPIRIMFIVFFWLLLIFICYFLIKTSYFKDRYTQDSTNFFSWESFKPKKITRQWIKIMKRLDRDSEAEWKLSIIEANNLLDNVFKRIGRSEAIKEKGLDALTNDIIPNIAAFREVHQIRDAIVNDPDYRLEQISAKRVLEVYAEIFNHLDVF